VRKLIHGLVGVPGRPGLSSEDDFYPSFPIASVGQTSMALSAAAISPGESGCLEK